MERVQAQKYVMRVYMGLRLRVALDGWLDILLRAYSSWEQRVGEHIKTV
jgi:hypothetical protein